MKKLWIFTTTFLCMGLLLSSSCKKSSDDNNNNPSPSTITDQDGNVYHSVTIGSQVWMVENLKTTKYSDGTSIPTFTVDSIWAKLTTPAYCWYDNNIGYKSTYGALYNWYAVQTGKLCPTGWRVPTEADWNILVTNLGGEDLAGGKLKEAGTSHWVDPNTAGTNESGFTAFGASMRYCLYNGQYYESSFGSLGYSGYWWSSTYNQATQSYIFLELQYKYGYTELYGMEGGLNNSHLSSGLSVRCIKN